MEEHQALDALAEQGQLEGFEPRWLHLNLGISRTYDGGYTVRMTYRNEGEVEWQKVDRVPSENADTLIDEIAYWLLDRW